LYKTFGERKWNVTDAQVSEDALLNVFGPLIIIIIIMRERERERFFFCSTAPVLNLRQGS